jgi:ubiquinone/menaquinone biosynthesis C-methylase UbiE
MNELLNAASVREMNLLGGERVLDLGSGLGQLTCAMARVVGPAGRVVAIDSSEEQIREAQRKAEAEGERDLVEFRRGDVLRLPLAEHEWGTFDVAHARFLLEHVRDPVGVVRGMAKALRPGGRMILEDDDHDLMRLWPEPEGARLVWQAYVRTYEVANTDPYIGRQLVSLMSEQGVRPVRNTWIFFGACSGHPDFPAYVRNLLGVLEGAREQVLPQLELLAGRAHEDAATLFAHAVRAIEDWAKQPNSAIWYATCWAEGVKPRNTAAN